MWSLFVELGEHHVKRKLLEFTEAKLNRGGFLVRFISHVGMHEPHNVNIIFML